MIDRPMKQVSLRKFRETIVDLRSVVEVSRRDTDGNIQILGYWTPYMQDVPGSKPLSPAGERIGDPSPTMYLHHDMELPKVIKTPEEAANAVSPSPRAFPKEAQTGRKKR